MADSAANWMSRLAHPFGIGGQPFDTCSGSGETADRDVIDVLLVDNMLRSQGHEPYASPHTIHVAVG